VAIAKTPVKIAKEWVAVALTLLWRMMSLPYAAVAEDSIQQNTSLFSALGMQRHEMSRGTCQIFQSCLGLQRDYEKPPNG
jgi:hypothetical protein